jgi:hypothetical protein
VFALPKSHILSHESSASKERMSYLVWMLGFILGMRLTDTEAGFLDAAPILPSELHDVVWHLHHYRDAMGYVDDFWNRHGPITCKGLVGAVNALFLSQRPGLLCFERFIYVYCSIDACYAVWKQIHDPNGPMLPHAKRIEHLCQKLRTVSPGWIRAIVRNRNAAMHDALFFGEPLGFATFAGTQASGQVPENVALEMQNLVNRFIFALLELPCPDYIGSAVDTRSCLGVQLQLPPP